MLQVAAEADNPTHLDLSLDQQRAKRSLRLSARANGMWAITGMLDEVDGAIWPKPWHRSPAPDTHDTTTGPRRADALTDMSKAGGGQTPTPAGCPRCPSSWIWRTCPPVTTRPGRRHPLGAGFRPVVVRGGVHGDLRDQTHRHLHPPRPRTKTTPGIRGPMGRADRSATAAASAADGPRGTATPTTSSTGKTAAEPTSQTWPPSVQDVITTCTTAGTPSPWTPTPSPSSPTPEDPRQPP